MKAHKSKYFTEVLQVCLFFKFHTKKWEDELSEGIKLMSVDQLYFNIMHNQFETTLIKEILCFLVSKLPHDRFMKERLGGSLHYLAGQDHQTSRSQIINLYYLQIALEQYCYLTDTELPESADYVNTFNFCELDVNLRFKLLNRLVSQVWCHVPDKKNQEDDEKEGKMSKTQDQKKSNSIVKIEECMILGEDNMNIYLFVPFLPEYLLTNCMGVWELFNKRDTLVKLQKLLKGDRNTNLLNLCENIYAVYSKLMKDQSKIEAPIRYHRVKSNLVNERKQRVSQIKNHLIDINQRYCTYLKNYNNRCWAYYHQRQNYLKLLEKSNDHKSLLEAFKEFILLSRSKVYQCKVEDQASILPNQCNTSYGTVFRDNCRINCRQLRIGSFKISFTADELFQRIIDGDRIDCYVLLEISAIALELSMQMLELKAANYFKKVQRMKQKQLRQQKQQKISEQQQEPEVKQKQMEVIQKNGRLLRKKPERISDSLSSLPKKSITMQLRPKSKRTKKFGIRTIDSDDSEQSENEEYKGQTKTKSGSIPNLEEYEYNNRVTRLNVAHE